MADRREDFTYKGKSILDYTFEDDYSYETTEDYTYFSWILHDVNIKKGDVVNLDRYLTSRNVKIQENTEDENHDIGFYGNGRNYIKFNPRFDSDYNSWGCEIAEFIKTENNPDGYCFLDKNKNEIYVASKRSTPGLSKYDYAISTSYKDKDGKDIPLPMIPIEKNLSKYGYYIHYNNNKITITEIESINFETGEVKETSISEIYMTTDEISYSPFIILECQAPGGDGGKSTSYSYYHLGGGGGGGGAFAAISVNLLLVDTIRIYYNSEWYNNIAISVEKTSDGRENVAKLTIPGGKNGSDGKYENEDGNGYKYKIGIGGYGGCSPYDDDYFNRIHTSSLSTNCGINCLYYIAGAHGGSGGKVSTGYDKNENDNLESNSGGTVEYNNYRGYSKTSPHDHSIPFQLWRNTNESGKVIIDGGGAALGGGGGAAVFGGGGTCDNITGWGDNSSSYGGGGSGEYGAGYGKEPGAHGGFRILLFKDT